MNLLFLLLCGASAGFSATLTLTPPEIFECQNGLGVAQVTWSGASGPVEVRLVQPDGPSMTGLEGPSGSETTDQWVADGLKFFLVNQAGIVEAIAVAHVSCGGTVHTIDHGLQSGSYFPLQIGNTWVYRSNNRILTGTYVVRSIKSTETISGKTYFVITEGSAVVAKLRGDNNGVIRMATFDGGEQVYLDPGSRSFQRTTYVGPLGVFSDALTFNGFVNPLEFDNTIFVRGIGLAHLSADMATGSSGGFLDSLELVEVRFPGVHLSVPAPTVSVSIETTDLDLTDQLVPNCALPCYFVACGIAGIPTDPPGTYRPCAQARIEARNSPGADVRLQLLDASGSIVFSSSSLTDAAGASFNYVRVPIYTTPDPHSNRFELLPAGQYRLVGSVLVSGQEAASSSISVGVR